MKITLPNGVELNGSTEELSKTVRALGYTMPEGAGDEWYFSDSRGDYVAISSMNASHAKNAALKLYREWVESLSGVKDMNKLCQMLSEGPTDPVIIALIKHFAKKVAEDGR